MCSFYLLYCVVHRSGQGPHTNFHCGKPMVTKIGKISEYCLCVCHNLAFQASGIWKMENGLSLHFRLEKGVRKSKILLIIKLFYTQC